MRGRGVLSVCVVVVVAWAAAPAQADHHLVKITEVYPGDTVESNAEFVELQMYSSGQGNLGPFSHLELYGANGALLFDIFPGDVALGGNQRTFLYATGTAEGRFGVEGDFGGSTTQNYLDPAGGAVCFNSETFGLIDCVRWGTMSNPPPSAGAAAPAIPDANSLARDVSGPPCPVGLDAGDDTNSSLADFALSTSPSPRPNAAPLTGCPDTRFTKTPPKKTTKRRAKFKFTASPAAGSFECKLDKKPFKPCTSPFKKRVKRGKHKLKVLAEDEVAPAVHRWKVVRD